MVFCGLLANFRVGASAKTTGEFASDVKLDVGIRHQKRQGVSVDRNELNTLEPHLDHSVDGVYTTTTDAHHLDHC